MSDFSADLPDFLNDIVENDVTPSPLDPIESNPYAFPHTPDLQIAEPDIAQPDTTDTAPEADTAPETDPAPILDTAQPDTDSADATPILEPADEEVTQTVEQDEPAPIADDAPAPAEPADDVPVIDDSTGLEDGVAGNHFLWSDDWFWQEVDGYCGPTAAAFLLNQFQDAGISNPEYMVERAVSLGLMGDPTEGMYTDDLATLLTESGLPAEMQTSNMEDLAMKLNDGYGIIACVDSGEIWGDEEDAIREDNMMDHFLVVSEIDFNRGVVTLTDPGAPYGNGLEVPIDQFEDAWADSGHTMVATTNVDAELSGAPGMAIVNATRSETIR